MPEDTLYMQEGKKKSNLFKRKPAYIAVLLFLVIIIIMFAYLYLSVTGAISRIRAAYSGPYPPAQITASIIEQDILEYNNLQQYIPYVLVGYSYDNVTSINLNATLYKYEPPMRIFILNISNECYYCGNTSAIESAMYAKLIQYGLIRRASDITIASPALLRSLPNDSLLVVLNGLMPETFFTPDANGITTLQYLLMRHTSILYVGDNFSDVLLPDSIVTPNPDFPDYLNTQYYSGNKQFTDSFYFNSSIYAIKNASTYNRYLTYKNAFNGSIAVFPNVPTSWKYPNETGYDLAKAIKLLFWLPKYAYGTRTVIVNNSSGQIGVLMNSIIVNYYPGFTSRADAGYVRVVVTANATYPFGISNSTYRYLYSSPQFYNNGTITMANSIITNQSVPLRFQIFTNSVVPVNIQPHISVYTLDSRQVYSTPLPFIHNISGNFTFLISKVLPLRPGSTYILKLHSFYGTEYAAGLLNISPLGISLLSTNITTDQFLFRVTSAGQPLSNINYSMRLNGQYPNNGVIKGGQIYYSVPKGTPTITGTLSFNLTVMNKSFYYLTGYHPLPFQLNPQYIVIGVVILIMLAMIILVRAPQRDEFYIDVPNLPEIKKTDIKLKASEIILVFDKLNALYHWKYMPLSKTEIKYAISNYIKYNNFPVGLTYNNIEALVDQLSVGNYLVSADSLYAPSQWETSSQHDIEYLATFKKLRIYLVTHAYIFTDLDASTSSDIVATVHNERKYIVIYSKTTKYRNLPVYAGSKTYLVFLNSYRLEDFRQSLYSSNSPESEELKIYIAFDYLRLVDADNPDELAN